MIDTQYIETCILKLEQAFEFLEKCQKQDTEYDIYRLAVVKQFELILELVGQLLKKYIRPFFHTNKSVDTLIFKDIFRHAGKYGLLEIDEVQRWIAYRDNRNETTHNYGVKLANDTLPLVRNFIDDAKKIVTLIQKENDIARD